MSTFAVRQVDVVGASAVSDLTIRHKIDPVVRGETIFTMDVDRIARTIEELPFVREVTVDRHIPGGVTVRVDEYEPLAFGIVGTRGWLVAQDGRILAPARLDDWSTRVPVVRIQQSDAGLGDRVGNEPALRLLREVPVTFPGSLRTVDVKDGQIVAETHEGYVLQFGRDDALSTKLLVVERLLGLYGSGRRGAIDYIDVSVPERPAVKSDGGEAASGRVELAGAETAAPSM
jgi:cell division septal protein FtsQ